MRTVLATVVVGLLAVSGCGGGGSQESGPSIVVTTNILGDVVRNLVGEEVDVEVLMPAGTDPHDFAPSAQQVAALREADVVVANGLGFEAGLTDTIQAAAEDGVTVVTASDAVDVLPLTGDEGGDPHFFTDPRRMHAAAAHVAEALAEHVDGLGSPAFDERVARYLAALDDLDAEVAGILDAVPEGRRTLVTNHEVFAYLADRYGFEVLGTVVPGGSTLAEPSAADLADLSADIATASVPAVFAETSSPARLAETLASEGTDVSVVELYSESLGEPGSDGATYLDMVRTNARRIAAALG